MKKFITVLLAAVLSVAVVLSFAGCNTDDQGEKITVGVILNSVDVNTETVKSYLNDEIGPALNMEFKFSDAISTSDAVNTFIENCQLSGVQAMINLDTNDSIAAINKCKEYEMYIQNQKSKIDTENEVDKIEYNLGNCGASVSGMNTAYQKVFDDILNDGKNHSVCLFSGPSVYGAESHVYSAVGVLNSLKSRYNLTYKYEGAEITAEQLARTSIGGKEIETGNSNIKLFYVNGMQNYTDPVSGALNTGNYDIFVATMGFSQFSNYVDAAEKSKGIDIKVVGTASIEAQTGTGFSTGALSQAVINPLTVAYAVNCISIRNAIDGHADMYKKDGSAIQLDVNPWVISSAENYEKLSQLDNTETGKWVITGEEAKNYCVRYNSETTIEDQQKLLEDLADIDAIFTKKGI